MKIFKLLCLLPFALLGSCSNEEIMPESNPDPTLDKCISILNEFKSQIGEYQTRSTASNVTSFSKKTLRVPIGNMTRNQSSEEAAQNPTDTTEVELCFMELDNGGKKGYAYVCPDERTNGVYAYVPNGCISDTARIAPLDSCIQCIPKAIEHDIALHRYNPNPTSKIVHIRPIVKTAWHQKHPYNKYIINQYAIGCGPLAAGQVIAACGRFKGTYYGNKDIDFKTLTNPNNANDYEIIDKTALFLHEVAMFCQAKFGETTGTYPKSIYQYLNELGYICDYREGALDLDYLYKNMVKKIPHIIAGYDKVANSRHMWIIDGLNAQYTLDNHYMTGPVHCNWGQGDGLSNGWFTEYTHYISSNNGIDRNYNTEHHQIYITAF